MKSTLKNAQKSDEPERETMVVTDPEGSGTFLFEVQGGQLKTMKRIGGETHE